MRTHNQRTIYQHTHQIKSLQQELDKAEMEIKRLSREVDLDIPSMIIKYQEKEIAKQKRALEHGATSYAKVSHLNGELKQQLADVTKQRDEAEKGYFDRQGMSLRIQELETQVRNMKTWGQAKWKELQENQVHIERMRKDLKEMYDAEVKYLERIHSFSARLG